MYYLEKDNEIIAFSNNKTELETTINYVQEYKDLEILETNKEIVEFENKNYFIDDEEYIEKQEEKERERLNTLSMTRSDFFDGFIMAFNLGQSELRTIVEQILNSINITDVEIKVALNNFDNALNFYRKHTLFTLLNGVEIPYGKGIDEELVLVFTSDIWDKFFDTKDYKELRKAIKSKPIPVDDDSDTDNIEEMENL